ncbi:MAG TPA: ComEA family DNA-binding protein [Bacilli bacterium]|nr:MAG: ComE operon protein 1 [Tenericutes bacterium ADurb.BinA124]HNZ50320.1 ComEA family DNA-binding protein [Bacilli bacterium]HOH17974.1 ComEA family DNA-binding protein [Bacilli bacterium]HPN61176.1 ComEA family DNA-binding protein [Bacilli bacterium]HPX83731.1 ComEA family DNA-binding protein [Bacilli bacterium]
MKPKWKIIIIVFAIIILIVVGLVLGNPSEPAEIFSLNQNEEQVVNDLVVEIKGEVNRPGLYFLNSNSRINDAIILAGGFTTKANTAAVNLALKVTDGMVILVPANDSDVITTKISINRASLNELMELNGIGEVKARNIINYRNEKGLFKTLEELLNVEGISQKLFDQIKDDICL